MQWKFNNPQLLEQALTHSSLTKDDSKIHNNERLEFLGDAVLKLVFSQYLFERYPHADEGLLTKYRSKLISDSLLEIIGYKLGFDRSVKLGQMMRNKTVPKSIVGNVVEAIIGALYLDQGFAAAEKFILELWQEHIEIAIEESTSTDYKSLLQERIQKEYKIQPEYKTLDSFGPDHEKSFEVGVYLAGRLLAKAEAPSKKLASQLAAKKALEES